MRPVLLITAGPTGAGKTLLIDAALRQLRADGLLAPSARPQPFLIDELVENDPAYKAAVRAILEAYGLESLAEPSDQLYERFGAAYADVRSNTGCGRATAGGCDAELDARLDAALAARQSIVFETTGQHYPSWLVRKTRDGDYRIVLAYALADFCQLLLRNRGRAFEQAAAFLADPQRRPAPRLPDVGGGGAFRARVERAKQVLLDIVARNCLFRSEAPIDEEFCAGVPVDRILVFDTNRRPLALVADLTRESIVETDQLERLLENYMSTQAHCQ